MLRNNSEHIDAEKISGWAKSYDFDTRASKTDEAIRKLKGSRIDGLVDSIDVEFITTLEDLNLVQKKSNVFQFTLKGLYYFRKQNFKALPIEIITKANDFSEEMKRVHDEKERKSVMNPHLTVRKPEVLD